jgi:hypothetical protein
MFDSKYEHAMPYYILKKEGFYENGDLPNADSVPNSQDNANAEWYIKIYACCGKGVHRWRIVYAILMTIYEIRKECKNIIALIRENVVFRIFAQNMPCRRM